MDGYVTERIERAKWLLSNAKHAAMATVNADGSPHNAPYLFMASADLTELYWGSHPDSQHSQNILRDGNMFVVLYEANTGGGLYIRAIEGRIAEGEELDRSLERHNQIRAKSGKEPLPLDYYSADSPQRMWIANTEQFWVNASEKDENGLVIQDFRYEVQRPQLL